ncbi:hypothetical protein BMT55_12890 [Listeria newyorkensis]|uniref:DUF2187 domain-containing protein n=1 Tax=Listeria newyorkensis TaxID=1497681 RepID=A0ABX4XJD6_9LIST|nr:MULTISPECIES: DUF2187 domain-containing protein [Listeria]KGL42446.1 hypothetical protein EP56_09550 [Listeriaceae bacterium FSL A5-0209]KGL45570.1 hypothetical protein EP58_03645 [Listeria newyorkensis]PNP89387.1 hypothetical protein BMT55_12890 [Listeria newyorkensis]RQW66646.1 DUF2187 domain-containing protein [Listeria sp. SHR_NRA_18]WAO22957.1 DUF2187 domain-containing protein [Listeria newyorkensis]
MPVENQGVNLLELRKAPKLNPEIQGEIEDYVTWEREDKLYFGRIEKMLINSAIVAIDEDLQKEHNAPVRTVVNFKKYRVVELEK